MMSIPILIGNGTVFLVIPLNLQNPSGMLVDANADARCVVVVVCLCANAGAVLAAGCIMVACTIAENCYFYSYFSFPS
jgi:hypothetical protein